MLSSTNKLFFILYNLRKNQLYNSKNSFTLFYLFGPTTLLFILVSTSSISSLTRFFYFKKYYFLYIY